jgi:hypothetical protein
VVATDVNPRALAFTQISAALNGIQNVETRAGSLFEPVAGERFDRILSNPPFVITPRTVGEDSADQFTYRDGGLPGDDIVASLIRSLPDVLAPGGTAQLLGNWEVPEGSAWEERPQIWAGPDTDAWFIQREQVGPEQYAETWLQDASETRDRRHYQDAYAAYLADFASRNVSGIGFGMVFLRRPAGGRRVNGGSTGLRRSRIRSSSLLARIWGRPWNGPTGWRSTTCPPPTCLWPRTSPRSAIRDPARNTPASSCCARAPDCAAPTC